MKRMFQLEDQDATLTIYGPYRDVVQASMVCEDLGVHGIMWRDYIVTLHACPEQVARFHTYEHVREALLADCILGPDFEVMYD